MGTYTTTDRPVPNGYVRGGMGRISDTMVEAAKEQGVEFRTRTLVKRIVVEKGVTTGVELPPERKNPRSDCRVQCRSQADVSQIDGAAGS